MLDQSLEMFTDTKKVLARKWKLGWRDRGLGHGDWGIIDGKDVVIAVEMPHAVAKHIVDLHNASLQRKKKVKVEHAKNS